MRKRIRQNETMRKEFISNISHDIHPLLPPAPFDQEAHILKVGEYNVDRQIRRLIHSYEWKIDLNNLMLSHDISDVEITADGALLDTVWDNLLSNALKYNSTFAEVEIELMEHKNEITVSFKDTGIGMDVAVKQHVFERIYREDTANSHRTRDSGLGLSIVHKVVFLHRGGIDVESNQNDQGSTFTVMLPKR